MEKAQRKTRDIKFYSEKNSSMVLVHSREARQYCDRLETDGQVKSYECSVILDRQKYIHVARHSIRKEYFAVEWASDFVLRYVDGRFGVRELVRRSDIMKRAALERLEFSRRYWVSEGVYDWKIVVMEV